jgi:Ca2+-transporting ATPase
MAATPRAERHPAAARAQRLPEPAAAAEAIGLTSAEAAQRLARDGPNALPQRDRRGWPRLLADVLREPMLLLLCAAAGLYLLLGEARDAAVLGLSVLVVVALTLYQAVRAEHALRALRDLAAPLANAWRDGVLQRLPAASLVVGDVVRIAEGERVPADARLLEASDLHVDNSLLTGESVPVALAADADADDAHGRVQAGTLVVRGVARAQVAATGARTAIGRIGTSLGTLRSGPSPLQREIRRLVAWFAAAGIASSCLVAALYVALRGGWLDALLAGITLAMANIPEEFPVVLAVFLALGAWRMARQRVLVRQPPAIEALGAVTVLCTDKTGTLTENRMALAALQIPDGAATGLADAAATAPGQALLRIAALASDADGHDPMDRAFHAAARGLPPAPAGTCLRRYPVSAALPVYAHAWRAPDGAVGIACKGAPEAVATLCALSPQARTAVLSAAAAMAASGLRVLAVAEAAVQGTDAPAALAGLPFAWRGLAGLADPVRAEVPDAIAEARAAGVRVVMLTGDHPDTARAIARAAGLAPDARVALGSALGGLDPAQLQALAARTDVFARVRPEHKLRLVQALRDAGEVVAMTGDGVNDAPALAAAHVGVAMGGRGTDVARESAAIVLLDDDFVSVVRAIRMGRAIYDNLHRAARYIVSVHVPITGLALLPLLLGTPLVLLPLHVVLMELIIDPASAIVLEREPPAADLMRRPPRAAAARLMDARAFAASVLQGSVVFAAVAASYVGALDSGLQPAQAAALAFAALACGSLALVQLHRGARRGRGPAAPRNRAFAAIVAATLAMLAAVTWLPVPAHWLGFARAPLPWLLGAALLPGAALALLRGLARAARLQG